MGQKIWVHDESKCKGEHCCIHNPSDHHMKDFPTNWRDDRYLMERICPCGVGHPDPDDLAFKKRYFEKEAKGLFKTEEEREEYVKSKMKYEGVHGCCGCCNPFKIKEEKNG